MNVQEDSDGKPWYDDVKMFLKEGAYPTYVTTVDKKTICLPILSQ